MGIKASDLRRGNLLTLNQAQRRELWHNQIHAYNEFFKVLSIFDDNEICLELDDESVDMEIKDTEPIPLTEELLLRFGFEKPAHSFIGERFHITKQDGSDYWFMAFNKNNAYIKKIKYVHQLQNWSYLINDKELELKNPPVKDQEG